MFVGRDADGPGTEICQCAEEHEVARRTADHDVARVEQRVAQQVQELIAAGGQHDLFDRQVQLLGRAAIGGKHPLEDRLSKRQVADRRSVL